MEPSDFIETETAVQIFSVNFAKHRLRRTSATAASENGSITSSMELTLSR